MKNTFAIRLHVLPSAAGEIGDQEATGADRTDRIQLLTPERLGVVGLLLLF
jgi:hypothetical protein